MNTCLNCGKPVTQLEGKRERKFCDATCRLKKWQADQVELRKKVKQMGLGSVTGKPSKKVENTEDIPIKTYQNYKDDISKAVSVSEIEMIVKSSDRDITLADWQKRQIIEYGIKTSKSFDF